MEFELIEAGCCYAFENIILSGGRLKKLRLPSLVGILFHPTEGIILFDTGYSWRFYEATARVPHKLFSWLTPTDVAPEDTVRAKLEAMGFDPELVTHVIVSHFHADHVGGLKDFPNARIVCAYDAYHHVINLKEIEALRQGVLLELLPDDMNRRIWLFDKDPNVKKSRKAPLGNVYDLFDDGTILLNHLPGHHIGQIGALLNTSGGKYFMISDACWLSRSFEENRMPSLATRWLQSDWKAYGESLDKVALFHKKNPDVHIIPSHCPEVLEYV